MGSDGGAHRRLSTTGIQDRLGQFLDIQWHAISVLCDDTDDLIWQRRTSQSECRQRQSVLRVKDGRRSASTIDVFEAHVGGIPATGLSSRSPASQEIRQLPGNMRHQMKAHEAVEAERQPNYTRARTHVGAMCVKLSGSALRTFDRDMETPELMAIVGLLGHCGRSSGRDNRLIVPSALRRLCPDLSGYGVYD